MRYMASQGFACSSTLGFSPHFSQNGYCGDGSTRAIGGLTRIAEPIVTIHRWPDCVPLHRPSRRTLKYDCEGLSRVALLQSPSVLCRNEELPLREVADQEARLPLGSVPSTPKKSVALLLLYLHRLATQPCEKCGLDTCLSEFQGPISN